MVRNSAEITLGCRQRGDRLFALRLDKRLLMLFLLIATALGCGGLTVQSNPIWIDKVIITGEIDDQGMPMNESDVFSPDQPIVYCFVEGRGSDNISVRLKWYHEDQLISDHTMNLGTKHHNYAYLRLNPRQRWPLGEYRIEVALVNAPVKVVRFSVKDGQ